MARQMSWRPKSLAAFRKLLLRWFRANRRVHPWRRDRDPYRVWLAEVMLQQTRIAAVIPYYDKFLERFPDVGALANMTYCAIGRASAITVAREICIGRPRKSWSVTAASFHAISMRR